MGLFGGGKKHFVSTSVSRVLPDNGLPDTIKGAVTSNIFNEGDQLVERILDGFRTSVSLRAEQMYAYGKKDYIFGLPKATLYDPVSGVEGNVAAALREQYDGQSIQIQYAKFGPPNLQHHVWLKLAQVYQYDHRTNSMPFQGDVAYLTDFCVYVTPSFAQSVSTSTLEQWGRPPSAGWTPEQQLDFGDPSLDRSQTPIRVNAASTGNYAVVYVRKGRYGKRNTHAFTISLTDLDFSKDIYQAQYTRFPLNQDPVGSFWNYTMGTGTFATLDGAYTPELDELGSFFPIGYFRYDHTDWLGNKTSAEYRSSAKLTKYLGMDYDQVASAIHDNPDIGDVAAATVMLAVPAQTSDPHEMRYLFDFFMRLYQKTGGDTVTVLSEGDIVNYYARQEHPAYGYIIQDKLSKIALSMDALIKTHRHITGKKGTYSHEYKTVTVQFPGEFQRDMAAHVYRHQVTETLCEEIQVVNLFMKYWIWRNYATMADETDSILLIPLDHSITEDYPAPFKEILYSRSLHYFYHSHQVQVIKWYQTGFFQFLMIVVAIVITVWTCGSDGGSALAAAIQAGSWVAVWAILEPLLIKMFVGMVMAKLFVKLVGEEAAFLLALVAACYGFFNNVQIPYVGNLLTVSSSLLTEVAGSYNEKMQGLAEENKEFTDLTKAKYELLEDAQKLLEQDMEINPLVFLGESPTDCFNRTIHSGNVGARSLDALTYYVDSMLELPSFSDTMA